MTIMADDFPPEDPDARSVDGDDLLPGMGGNISWCWDFDFAALVDAVTSPAPWLRADEPDGPDRVSETAGSAAGENADPRAGSSADGAAAELADPACEQGADPEADEAAFQEAVAAGRARELPLEFVAGRVAENLPVGPGLAGWLALARAADLEDGALAGVAASFRRRSPRSRPGLPGQTARPRWTNWGGRTR